MKVFGADINTINEVAKELELYVDEVHFFPRGGYGFNLRPKGERFRVDPIGPDDDYFVVCAHGHEAMIRGLIERNALVVTALARYGPWLLEKDRWEEKQKIVRERHRKRFPSHQQCGCA